MPKKVEVREEACACHCCCGKALVAIVAIASLVLAIIACVFSAKAAKFAEKSYEAAVLPAWWEENLAKMNNLYRSADYVNYATEQTDSTIEQFNSLYGSTVSEDTTDTGSDTSEAEGLAPAGEILSAEDIASLKANGVTYWPENARFTILEFADASCGYCKRQVGQDQTIDSVMSQYPDSVNMIFKNMPIFNETAAEAMACSEDYLSADTYHQFVVAVFQMDDATSADALAALAANYGADATTIANCVNNADKAAEVAATMKEGQEIFGISGTPSSVIIDNESGKYAMVPGAYPVETFVETIEGLLNN